MKTRRRHFTKKRIQKRGGAADIVQDPAHPNPVYICPAFDLPVASKGKGKSKGKASSKAVQKIIDDAQAECLALFSAENNLVVKDVSDDGNCFYHTLKQYGRIMGVNRLYQHTNWLRRHVARFIERHWNERYLELYQKDSCTFVRDIRERGMWDCEAGDVAPSATPDAFRINLIIYNMVLVKQGEEAFFQFNKSFYRDPSYDITVQILRVNDGHYMLLLPIDTPNIPDDTDEEEPPEVDPLGTPILEYIDGEWIEADLNPAELIKLKCHENAWSNNNNNNQTAATASSSNANLSYLLNKSLSLNNTKKKGKKAAKKTTKKTAKKTAKKSGKNAANQNNVRQQMINQILANKSLNNVTRNAMIQSLYE